MLCTDSLSAAQPQPTRGWRMYCFIGFYKPSIPAIVMRMAQQNGYVTWCGASWGTRQEVCAGDPYPLYPGLRSESCLQRTLIKVGPSLTRPSLSQIASLDFRSTTLGPVMPPLPYAHFLPTSQYLKKKTKANDQICHVLCNRLQILCSGTKQ